MLLWHIDKAQYTPDAMPKDVTAGKCEGENEEKKTVTAPAG